MPVAKLRIGDLIRYPEGPFEDGATWVVMEIRLDVSRPGYGWYRLVTSRLRDDLDIEDRAGDHPPGEAFTLVRRP